MPLHQFNNFTGRLKTAINIRPFYPLKPVPLQTADPPKMIWDTIKTKAVSVNPPTMKYSTVKPEILEQMKYYQKNLDKPVYLMGGTKDKVLFGFTLALTLVCAFQTIHFFATNLHKK